MPTVDESQTATVMSDVRGPSQMLVQRGVSFFAEESDLLGSRLSLTKHIPEQFVERYINLALKRVEPKRLEDGTWFTEIPGFDGVWGNNEDLEKSLSELREVLFDWLIIKIDASDRDIPAIEGVNPNIL
jgi:predicted RNase H-like HicB family nuclease